MEPSAAHLARLRVPPGRGPIIEVGSERSGLGTLLGLLITIAAVICGGLSHQLIPVSACFGPVGILIAAVAWSNEVYRGGDWLARSSPVGFRWVDLTSARVVSRHDDADSAWWCTIRDAEGRSLHLRHAELPPSVSRLLEDRGPDGGSSPRSAAGSPADLIRPRRAPARARGPRARRR